MAVKLYLNPALVNHTPDSEILPIDIYQNVNKFRIITAHRPGWYDAQLNRKFLENLGGLTVDSEHTCVMGDFNLPHIDWNSYVATSQIENELLQYVLENNFIQHVKEPTRQSNILDLCFSSENDVITNLKVGDCFSTSDHCIITFDLHPPNFLVPLPCRN